MTVFDRFGRPLGKTYFFQNCYFPSYTSQGILKLSIRDVSLQHFIVGQYYVGMYACMYAYMSVCM